MHSVARLLPAPPELDHDISPWVDEQIWGHRILDSQTPWLVFLEFLSVAEASSRSEGGLLAAGGTYPLLFRPRQRMYLRNILFNNQALNEIADKHPHSETAWERWLDYMAQQAQGTPSRDFAYLKGRFESFKDFAALVGLLRSSVVESESNKRWTSRFVFPFGPEAIYEDLNIKGGSPSREYIYFGRTGELLYLMLCRSGTRTQLQTHLAEFLSKQNRWNRLLALLQPAVDEDAQTRGKSYLPYESHPCFDALAEDWLAILDLQLPGFDPFPHLVTLGTFHIMLYQIAVAAEWRDVPKPTMVCEVVAPRKTLVRELSSESYLDNYSLPAQAVEAYVQRITDSDEWQRALLDPSPFLSCRNCLKKAVWWPKGPDDYSGPSDPEALLREFRSIALTRHKRGVANVHRTYGGYIGLVSRRGTTRLRYAPNDQFLRTVLLANVGKRMELNELLGRLYERYGLVFGDREAELVLSRDRFDKKAFQRNVRRLEQRLASLGMLRRLSDACAYVENPHRRRSE